MALTFITGNRGKFSEAETVLGIPLVQATLPLPELQDIDPYNVMRHKLEAAKAHGIVPCIVEDSSLMLSCLNSRLPGPFIKAFEEALGLDGILALVTRLGDARATGITLVGYVDEDGTTRVFEGRVDGELVTPQGDQDFGYGPLFKPEGSEKTFGQMSRDEKHASSSRGMAFRKLKEHLERA